MNLEKKRIAIIRVRGTVGVRKEVSDTLKMLCLFKNHNCVIVPNNKGYTGMLRKVKDYVTWGEINEETFKKLLEKRGKLPAKQKLTKEYIKQKTKLDFDSFTKEFFAFKKELKDIPGLKKFFKLSPPIRGFERKGIKKPFSMGGVLGYRKNKINDLLQRMI